jgi:DNA-directed RNA polymerase subunit E'/Rpb7
MVDKNIYYETILWNRVVISPDNINKSLDKKLTEILVENNEGKCIREGYIKEDSIKIIKRSVPYIYGSHMNGMLHIDILYSAEICCPMKGNIIKCTVQKINKLGILGVSGPLSIIIARQFHKNISIFKDIEEDTEILVEVIDKKFNINESNISVIAKIYNESGTEELNDDLNTGVNKKSDDADDAEESDMSGEDVEDEVLSDDKSDSDNYNYEDDEYDVSDTDSGSDDDDDK